MEGLLVKTPAPLYRDISSLSFYCFPYFFFFFLFARFSTEIKSVEITLFFFFFFRYKSLWVENNLTDLHIDNSLYLQFDLSGYSLNH